MYRRSFSGEESGRIELRGDSSLRNVDFSVKQVDDENPYSDDRGEEEGYWGPRLKLLEII